MNRKGQFAAVLLLALAPVLAAPNSTPPDTDSGEKPAPRLLNPGNVLERLLRMTPEQRERMIERLPPARQAIVRQRLQQFLQRFDSLPKAEQERRLRLGDIFASLPPERQNLVRRQIRAFNQLPDDRRRLVGAAFQRLRRLTEEERQAVLDSPAFRRRYSPAEQQIIADLSENLPPPSAPPQHP